MLRPARRPRYRGRAKAGLQLQLTGAAISLARIDVHPVGVPRARTRTSRFAALGPAGPKPRRGREEPALELTGSVMS
ncbi:hypothetical protein [Streptomyces sp. WG7]|uniref:hypothetical protein n=1 Tax=Streptomyces sp. WG7 TaxID=3417650 RepID=UPI003CF9EA34